MSIYKRRDFIINCYLIGVISHTDYVAFTDVPEWEYNVIISFLNELLSYLFIIIHIKVFSLYNYNIEMHTHT